MPYQTIAHATLYYEQHHEAPDDSATVVFLNGLLADTTGWGFQVRYFARHFRVLLSDCVGQGKSSKPAFPYPPAQHAQDLIALLDALHISQAHVIGLSNGGAVALHLAATHPDRVRRMVLCSTYAATDAVLSAKLQSWLLALEQGGTRLRFDVATPWVWGQSFLASHGDLLDVLREKAANADPEAISALIQGALSHDVRPHLKAIHAPTLVLVGEQDLLTPPWYARTLADTLPHAELHIIPNTGHAPTIERPGYFNALALAFLQDESFR